MGRLKKFLISLLRTEYINFLVFKIRFLYFVYIKRRINVYENDSAVRANAYSVEMLKKGKTSDRPLRLIRPLSVIEAVNKKGSILSIGCRFETELLYLVGYGFNPKGIRGFDMISYSPWVDIGNMHKMPYSDSQWDSLIMGWTLPYSDQPDVAAAEVVRVVKNGGVVAIGLTAYPEHMIQEMIKSGQYAVRPDLRKQTSAEVISLFGNHVDKVYYQHDPPAGVEGTCAAIFSIKK